VGVTSLSVLLAAVASLGCDRTGTGTDSAAAVDSGAGGSDASGGTDASGGSDAGEPTSADVTFNASDGVGLTGYLTTTPGAGPGAPGVVLVHQFQLDDEQWGDLPEALAERGYRVLAFNLRGHGDSDPYGGGTLSDLLNDPNGAPLDLVAAIAYLTGPGGADAARIAVVGTSVGANLAVAAAINDLATTYVSFSARLPPTENLAGATASGMSSVFYLAGENDAGGQAADAQTMHDATTAPRDVHIYLGSADHGIAILNNQPDARMRLFDWLTANL